MLVLTLLFSTVLAPSLPTTQDDATTQGKFILTHIINLMIKQFNIINIKLI